MGDRHSGLLSASAAALADFTHAFLIVRMILNKNLGKTYYYYVVVRGRTFLFPIAHK